MEIIGFNVIYTLGTISLFLLIAFLVSVIIGIIAVLIFEKDRRIIIPKFTLVVLTSLEWPIKFLFKAMNIDTHTINNMDIIDLMIAKIRNNVYEKVFAETPVEKRAMFAPHCLRSPKCPAKTTFEKGIECINCGQCPLGALKKEAEELGYNFFIVPGGSFLKRLVKQYRPQAVLGIGCHSEIKEGSNAMAAINLPVQGVPLVKDGCMNTEMDVEEIRKVMKLGLD